MRTCSHCSASMKKLSRIAKTAAAGGVAALLLCACIPSVNPYYKPKDVTFEPALIGEWANDEETWVFEDHEDEGAYELTMTQGEKTGVLKATLFALRNHRFLDVIPIAEDIELADDQADIIRMGITTGHLVFHVTETAPQLKLALLEGEWFADKLEQEKGFLTHLAEDERTLITANTRELRRFLLRYVDGGNLFEDYRELTKQISNN